MTLTVSEASRAYREKRKAKLKRLERYEAALREIAADGFGVSRDDLVDVARQALNPTTSQERVR